MNVNICLQVLDRMPDPMARPLIPDGDEDRGVHLEASVSDPSNPIIGILGTGDFSRSLAKRLLAAGYQVVVGSRTPKCFVALFPEEVEVSHAPTVDLVFSVFFLQEIITCSSDSPRHG